MKYKPTTFKITQEAANRGDNLLTFVSLIGEAYLTIEMAKKGIPWTFYCGKPGCKGSFGLSSIANRPQVCPLCGCEIDWAGIATREVKRCPQCGLAGNDQDIFCTHHAPAVRLESVEVPLGTQPTPPKRLTDQKKPNQILQMIAIGKRKYAIINQAE